VPLPPPDLALLEAVGDVVQHAHVREERVLLEDRIDLAPVGRHADDRDALDRDRALGRLLEAGDHPQRRRLAAPRRAQQREELAVVNVEVQPVDGDQIVKALGHPSQGDDRVGLPSHGGNLLPARRDMASVIAAGTRTPCRASAPLRGARAGSAAPRSDRVSSQPRPSVEAGQRNLANGLCRAR
jgi:hypothetical protein